MEPAPASERRETRFTRRPAAKIKMICDKTNVREEQVN